MKIYENLNNLECFISSFIFSRLIIISSFYQKIIIVVKDLAR